MSLEDAFLYPAVAISVVWWVPQLVKVLREGVVGVSANTWAISTANLLLWGAWGLQVGQPLAAASEFTKAAGSALVLWKVGVNRRVLATAGACTASLALGLVEPALASAGAIGGVVAVRAPQLLSLLRGTQLSNTVSSATWLVSALSNALWLCWGVAGDHPTMIVGASLSASLSIAIAALATHQRRTA